MNNKAEHRLRHPRPGSAIEAARNFGVDLSLVIERLRLTPEERVSALQQAMAALAHIRGVARKPKGRLHD